MVTKIRQLLGKIIGAALAAVVQYSGTAALYLGTSTLLAAVLLTAIMSYLWNIDREKWYRALAILQGVELVEMQQAARDRAAEIGHEEVLERRAANLRREEFERDITQRAVFWQLPADEPPPPPPPPDDTEKIDAARKQADAEYDRIKSAGLAEMTRIIGSEMPPNKAKEVIRRLWKDGAMRRVLQVLTDMEEKPRGRILNAMQETNDEELKDLCEILQRIGDGEPAASALNEQTKEP